MDEAEVERCLMLYCIAVVPASLSLSLSPIRNWVLARFAGSTVLT